MKRSIKATLAASIIGASILVAGALQAQEAPLYPGWNLTAGTNQPPDAYILEHPECDVMTVWGWNPEFNGTEYEDPAFAEGWRIWSTEMPQEVQQLPMLFEDKGYWVFCGYID